MSDRDCENCKHHTEKGCDSWDCEFERKVTRKEAIKVFNDMKKGIYPFDPTVYLDIAINSLEIDERYELEYENAEEIHREKEQAYMQGYEDASKKYRKEPCGDAVSRKAINNLRKYNLVGGISTVSLKDINKLPPVNSQQPKIGHWILKYNEDCCGELCSYWACSECGRSVGHNLSNIEDVLSDYPYCHCGAKMEESEE